jgi:hypothetical protein
MLQYIIIDVWWCRSLEKLLGQESLLAILGQPCLFVCYSRVPLQECIKEIHTCLQCVPLHSLKALADFQTGIKGYNPGSWNENICKIFQTASAVSLKGQ